MWVWRVMVMGHPGVLDAILNNISQWISKKGYGCK